ncbi:transglutaminase-like putative cysteine protease [Hymenobacter sp. UYAg731]
MQASVLSGRWRGLLSAFLLVISYSARAQNEPIRFGVVDSRELTAAPFEADSTASAVVLCDFGRSRLKGQGGGFQVIFERVTRIKILKKPGYEYATVEIPLYRRNDNQEKVTNLRGFTYNLVNNAVEKTRLETSGAFLEKRTPTVSVQKFTLPNVRVGSVIEFAYTLTSDFLFNFQDWTFQRDIPVRWSEYRVSIPSFYRYKIIYQGAQAFAVNQATVGSTNLLLDNKIPTSAGIAAGQSVGSLNISAPTEEHTWALKDVPAFSEEPFMTTAGDYVARLDFELTGEQWPDEPYHDLTGTWEKVNATLLADEEFGGRLGHINFMQAQLQGLATRYPAITDRAAAVRQLVMAAVRYDGTDRYYALDPLRKAYEAHRGTSADVNLLLLAALREAGIPAQPLLLSTRAHGAVSKEYPLLERFNYVAALVPLADGKDLLLDATEPLLPCGVLPKRCLNRVARLITKNPDDSRWVDLAPAQRRVHYQQVALTLDAQGGLTGKVHDEHGGYAGAEARARLAGQGEKKYLATATQRHENWTLSKPTLAHADNVDKPLTLDYEFTQLAGGAAATGPLYLSPLSEFGLGQNPFRREQRDFPIDFGLPQDETMVVNLTLPAGYELATVPKPAVVELPDGGGRFLCSVAAATPGTVTLISRLTLRNPVYSAAQYPNLRELYRLMLEKHGEKLIIQKKAGS